MKRHTYFISSRSSSTDVLAAQLALSVKERFSKISGFGVAGTALKQGPVEPTFDLEQVISLGLHDTKAYSKEASQLAEEILECAKERLPELAILVGYFQFQHKLAQFFRSEGVPVVLYGSTPSQAWGTIGSEDLAASVDHILGTTPKAPKIIADSKLPYNYMGTPQKGRVGRVSVSPATIGIDASKPIVIAMPGSNLQQAQKLLPFMEQLGERLLERVPNIQLIVPLTAFLYHKAQAKLFDPKKIKVTKIEGQGNSTSYGCFTLLDGMSLEVLSLSTVAMTGMGSTSLESALCKVPFVACAEAKNGKLFESMANEMAEQELGLELGLNDDIDKAVDYLASFLQNSELLQKQSEVLEDFSDSLKSGASESSAEYIGEHVVRWNQLRRSRIPRSV